MKQTFEELVVIIPAYNPDEKLIQTLRALDRAGFSKIILVNDGSGEECVNIFNEAVKILESLPGGVLLKHSVNLGQGRSYKTAFNYYLDYFQDTIGVIQCDADGQHHIEDVCMCAKLLLEHPTEFIIGVRDFKHKGIPFRSRFGNICTSIVFKYFCGINLTDTQTGLKGIPKDIIYYLMEAVGERYEYATSVLLEVKKHNVPIRQFGIKTIYINGNESSHFNPILDSVRIYSVLLKYIAVSLSAFIIDIVLFTFFISILKPLLSHNYIVVANYTAKVFSCSYSFFANKNLVFVCKGKKAKTFLKFAFLCLVQASISSFAVSGLYRMLYWNESFLKVIVDSVLFWVSFKVQQKWVFVQGE